MANFDRQPDPLKKIAARRRGRHPFGLAGLCGANPAEQAGHSKSAGIIARDVPVIAITLTAKTASNPPLPIAWSRGRERSLRSLLQISDNPPRATWNELLSLTARIGAPCGGRFTIYEYSLFPNQKDNQHAFSRL